MVGFPTNRLHWRFFQTCEAKQATSGAAFFGGPRPPGFEGRRNLSTEMCLATSGWLEGDANFEADCAATTGQA